MSTIFDLRPIYLYRMLKLTFMGVYHKIGVLLYIRHIDIV